MKTRVRETAKFLTTAGLLGAMTCPAPPLSASYTEGLTEFRSIDGSDNNPWDSQRGQAHTPLIRIAPSAYGDGIDLPRGVPVDSNNNGTIEANEQILLPNPRRVSNLVHDQGEKFIESRRRLNQLVFQFGQFLSHDTGLTEPNATITTGGATGRSGNERFNIPVPGGDLVFNFAEVPVTRSISVAAANSDTGRREQINVLSAYIDGSQVYGTDSQRAAALRTFAGGLLKTSQGPDGELMPYNVDGYENGNAFRAPAETLFLAGDVRANEQLGLIVMHTLWVREHNRLAREIAATEFAGADLHAPHVDEAIYQRARAVVAALLQKITYYEWLPALIGYGILPDYEGYNPDADPQSANEFTAAAFRIGHTMLPPFYLPTDPSGNASRVSLLEAFFNPAYIGTHGIDGILRGQTRHLQQEIDRFIVGEVRNFLFGPMAGGLDLPAFNLQRGRDHGVADFNTVREAYGLTPHSSFYSLSRNHGVAAALSEAYGSNGIAQLDLWTGNLCEPHLTGTNLGETMTRMFIEQFTRLRDGDRFYFENEDIYPAEFIETIHETSFADVIRRNSSVRGYAVNDYAFFEPGYHPFQPDCMIGKSYTRMSGSKVYRKTQAMAVRGTRRKGANCRLKVRNDGAFVNHMVLNASCPSRLRMTCFMMNGGKARNVTSAVFTGRHEPVLDPGNHSLYLAKFQAAQRGPWWKKAYRRGQVKGDVKFHAYHYWDGWGADTVTARVHLR